MGPWPVASVSLLFGILGISTLLPPSGLTLFRYSQSFDPTLSTSSLELLWALLTWVPARLVGEIPLSGEVHAALLPALCVAATAAWIPSRKTREIGLFTLLLLFWAFIVGSISDGLLQITGVDALVILFILVLASRWIAMPGSLSKAGWAWIGFFTGAGWVYAAAVSFLLGIGGARRLKPSLPFMGVGFVLNLLVFMLLRVRYPHPDIPLPTSVPAEFLQQWMGIGELVHWGDETSWIGVIVSIPGILGLLLVLISSTTVWVLKYIWNASAGRTVPVQLALFTLGVLPFAAILWWTSPIGDKDTPQASVESLVKNLRTLREKVPAHAHILLPPQSFGAMQYLSTRESIGRPTRIGIRPPSRLSATDNLDPPSVESEDFGSTVHIEYNGKNVVWISNESLEFEPQYLLDATTEVWAATPDFFVANNPVETTGQPLIRFEGRTLKVGSQTEPKIEAWNYNGDHFFLYRARKEEPWSFPIGEWKVEYVGYLLTSEFEWFGELTRPRGWTPLQRFY